ncbi:unnamed protein product, partial [marine sediment metagenome]
GEKKKIRLWLVAGCVYGVCCLLRPNVLFAFPFVIAWVLTGSRTGERPAGKLIVPAAIVLGIILVLLPFSLRNYQITGDISPPFGNGGFNFYVGNHPGAKGTYTYLKGISNSPSGQIKSAALQARRALGREVSLSEASNYWFRRGFRFIRERPLEYVVLLGRKFLLFWNAREIGQNIDFYFSRSFSSLLRFPLVSFGLIAPFAWLGLLSAIRRREKGLALPGLFLAGYLGSVIFFFVSARYRLPAVPFIILFTAYGLRRFAGLVFRV